MQPLEDTVLERCKAAVPSWQRSRARRVRSCRRHVGSSSFTMAVRCPGCMSQIGVLYQAARAQTEHTAQPHR